MMHDHQLTDAEERMIDAAWEKHKAAGPWNGEGLRPHLRPDGVPTRIDLRWMTGAERAISDAMSLVENAGGSPALTDALTLLARACSRVADHVEGREPAGPTDDHAAAEADAIERRADRFAREV